jgi:hypothetical protein
MYTLHATLAQGCEMSGPYSATLTTPDKTLNCSMSGSQKSVSCAPVSYPVGTSVAILTTINFPGDVPIWRAQGCDSLTRDTCTVAMTADRTVTIQAGCAYP